MDTFADSRREIAEEQRAFAERGAAERDAALRKRRYYYERLRGLLCSIVEPGKRVLCLRSDVGQYLDWVRPSRGLGVEISPKLTEIARARYPQHEFRCVDAIEDLHVDERFDYVLIVNAVNELFDVQATLEALRPACTPETRIVIVFYNFLWQPLAELAERLGIKRRQPRQSWLGFVHLSNLLHLATFEVVRRYRAVLWPFYIPGLAWAVNRALANLPPLDRLCLVQAVVARPAPEPSPREAATVSVVIPCKNERENVEPAVRRTPVMGAGTELVFCDDRSTDGTADEVRRMQREFPERDIRLVEGPGISKAENVWCGFDAAKNDILMILDGDLAVPPELLPRFYDALVRGRGEFVNGTRMVYPMRDQAMRNANVFGNKLFSLLFSHMLRAEISDTLCGTKALWRRDFERMRPFRGTWGTQDRWGDYELIFGAARLNLAHIDLPVRYMERTYGRTKMTGRLRNARTMLRMCLGAYFRLR